MPYEIKITTDNANKEVQKLTTAISRLSKAANAEVKTTAAIKNVKRLKEEVGKAQTAIKNFRAEARAAIKVRVNTRDLLTAATRINKFIKLSDTLKGSTGAVKFTVDTASAKEATTQINRLNKAVARTIELSAKKMTINTGSTSELRQINANIKLLSAEIERLAKNYQKSATAATKNTAALKRDGQAAKKAATQMKKTARSSKELEKSLVDTSQAAAMFRAGLLASGHSMGLFTAHTLVGAVAVYSFVKALAAIITVGSLFERSLAETAAIMGESKEQLKGLTNQMLELAETTKFTTVEVSDAATILAKTGMKTGQLASSLPHVLSLAAIGSMEMSKAADIAANSMFGFRLQATDLEMVVDTLAFTATNSNTSVTQLGSAISYAAPVAAAAGESFKNMAAMLAVMADSGIKASRAGTTMRRSFINLLKPTDKVKTIFSDLGVSIRDEVSGEMKSMVKVMEELTVAGVNAPDLAQIFGARAAPGMIAIWKDLATGIVGGVSKLKTLQKGMENVSGEANRMREQMEKNLIDTWKKFTSVLSVKATRAFDKVGESMTSVVKSMTDLVREGVNIDNFVDSSKIHWEDWKRILTGIPGVITEIGTALTVAGLMWDGFSEVISDSLDSAGTALRDFPANITAMAKFIGLGLGTIQSNFKSWGMELQIKLEKMSNWFMALGMRLSKALYSALDPMFNWLSRKFLQLSDTAKTLGLDEVNNKLEAMRRAMLDRRGEAEAVEKLNKANARHQGILKQLNSELKRAREEQSAQLKIAGIISDEILAERDARIANKVAAIAEAKAKNAAVRADLAAYAEKLKAEEDAKGANAPVPGTGRGAYTGLSGAEVKAITSDYKLLVTAQQRSVKSTLEQIAALESLKELNPFEATMASIEVSANSLGVLTTEFQQHIEVLTKGAADAYADKYASKAKEFEKQILAITVAYQKEATAIASIVNAQKLLMETEIKDEAREIKTGLMTGPEQIDKAHATELDQLEALFFAQYELQLDAQNKMYLSAEEYEERKKQMQIAKGKEMYEAYGGQYGAIFDLAESARAGDLAGMMANGKAMLAEEAKNSRKAFEAHKAISIAQALISTYKGVADAWSYGPILGPAFAALVLAGGMAQVKAIKATKFGGGAAASSSTGGTTVNPSATTTTPEEPTAPPSDALFNQTVPLPTTPEAAGRSDQPIMVMNLTVNAVDAAGVDQLLVNRSSTLTKIMQDSYDERGVSGGPLR